MQFQMINRTTNHVIHFAWLYKKINVYTVVFRLDILLYISPFVSKPMPLVIALADSVPNFKTSENTKLLKHQSRFMYVASIHVTSVNYQIYINYKTVIIYTT